MTIIEIPDSQAAELKAKAAAEGLTLKAWLGKLAGEPLHSAPRKPLRLDKACSPNMAAPSAEEIDENRRDMFRGS